VGEGDFSEMKLLYFFSNCSCLLDRVKERESEREKERKKRKRDRVRVGLRK
jgi:hypothetical protein